MHLHIYMYIYVCMYINIYICIYMYIYIGVSRPCNRAVTGPSCKYTPSSLLVVVFLHCTTCQIVQQYRRQQLTVTHCTSLHLTAPHYTSLPLLYRIIFVLVIIQTKCLTCRTKSRHVVQMPGLALLIRRVQSVRRTGI